MKVGKIEISVLVEEEERRKPKVTLAIAGMDKGSYRFYTHGFQGGIPQGGGDDDYKWFLKMFYDNLGKQQLEKKNPLAVCRRDYCNISKQYISKQCNFSHQYSKGKDKQLQELPEYASFKYKQKFSKNY